MPSISFARYASVAAAFSYVSISKKDSDYAPPSLAYLLGLPHIRLVFTARERPRAVAHDLARPIIASDHVHLPGRFDVLRQPLGQPLAH